MRLYKFLSAEFARQDLKERQIKISEFHDMNDPFELVGVHLSDPILHDLVIGICKGTLGALCFSGSWNNPMLWSLYADKHKGILSGSMLATTWKWRNPLMFLIEWGLAATFCSMRL
jgi:hypothetical protein